MRRLRLSILLAYLASCTRSGPAPADGVPAPRDAIVVLGHRPSLSTREIGYEARARIERGVALFHAGQATRILFSGGPATEDKVEADVMAEQAVRQGVPREAILRERASRDTIENAQLSVALLRRELRLTRAPRVLLVTSDYHSARAARLFRCAGADVVEMPAALALCDQERAKRRRSEWVVSLYYRFIDECKRAGRGSSHSD